MTQKLVSIAQFTVVDANDGIGASLTNEAITLQADAGGSVSSFAGANSIMTVRIGQYDDSANWTYYVSALGTGISYYGTGDVVPRLGFGTVDGALTGGAIQVATMSADSSYIDVTAARLGFASLTKRINVAKARNGASARTVKLSASPALAFLTPSGSTTPAPVKVTLTASVQGLASPTYAWQIDGVAQPGANTASFDVSAFAAGSAKTVKVIATDVSGSVEDVTTIASIKNGDTGATGAAGENFVVNLATTELWDAAVNTAGAAKYGGPFNLNGDGNQRVWGVDPFGRPALIWKTIGNDAASDADGGWIKTVPVVDSKAYMSVVYVRRTSGAGANGMYYHGCVDCLLPNGGGAAANPYFQTCDIRALVQNEWYVSIGFIHANGQATPSTGKGGLYRLSDGSQLSVGADYRIAVGQVVQAHRTYMYYSTDPTASLEWWGAGFFEINGNEPSLQTLIGNPNWQNSAAIAAAAADATTKAAAAQSAAITTAAADATTKANAAATPLTLIPDANMTVSGTTLKKTSGVNPAWDASVRSKDSYTGGAYVTFTATSVANNVMVGLNTDPAADSSYASIDYAMYCDSGSLRAYESGVLAEFVPAQTYAVGDIMTVAYDGTNVRYMKNGVVQRTVPANITLPLFLDSSFSDLNSSVSDVQFGPLSSNNWGAIGGTGKPADNANNTSIDASGNIQGVSAGTGLSVANNQDSIIRAPGGGVLTGNTGASVTGRLKIRLPVGWSNTMVKMTVDIYEYVAGYSCSLEISGYNESSTNSWKNVTARVLGGSNVEYPVYYGVDSGCCCVWIGATPGEGWVYPQVRVRDVLLGYSNFNRALWESGWIISFDTTAIVPGTGANQYSAFVTDTLPGADWAKTSKIPSNLAALTGSEGINNANVTLSSTGVLGGAGGGQIRTIGVFDGGITARATDSPPNAYPVGTTKEFKTRSAFTGLGGSETYFTLETIIQYSDASGGAAYQYAYVGATTWRRVGVCSASSWSGSWVQDLDRAAYTGALDATRNVNRGAWASGVAYVVGDVATSLGSSWSCITPHTSSGSLVLPVLPATSNANWTLLSAAGANGTTGYTLNFTNAVASLTQVGTVTKTAVTYAYDAQAYSSESYTRGCYVSAKPLKATSQVLIALNSDPTLNADWTSLDWAWFFNTDGNTHIYENGAFMGGYGAYTASTVLSISYDGQNIRYLKDGVVVRTVARSVGPALFFDSSIYAQNDGFTALQFGPMGEAGIRGSVKRYAAGAAWSDAVALTAVGGSAVAGDEVTITDGSTFVMTKYFSAGAWVAPGTVIDGNLMVTGSIKGASLDALAIRGKTLSAGVYMDAGSTTTSALTAPTGGTTVSVPVVDTTDFPTTGTALILGSSAKSRVMGSIRYTGKTQTALLSADWVGFDIPSGCIITPIPTTGGLLYANYTAGATSIQVQSEFGLFRKAGGSAIVIPIGSVATEIFTYTGSTISGNTTQTLTGVVNLTHTLAAGDCVILDLTPNIPTVTLATGPYTSFTIDSGSLESFSVTGGSFYLVAPASVHSGLGPLLNYSTVTGTTLTATSTYTSSTAGTYYLVPSYTNTVIGSSVASLITIGESSSAGVVSSVVGNSRGQSRFGSKLNPRPGTNTNDHSALTVQGYGGNYPLFNVASTSTQTGPIASFGGIVDAGGAYLDGVNIGFYYLAANGVPVQTSMITKQIGWLTPTPGTPGYSSSGIGQTMLGSAIAFATQNATTDYNKRRRTACSGGYAAGVGFYVPAATYYQGNYGATTGGFLASFSFKITDAAGTGGRAFIGMRAAVTPVPGASNPATYVNVIGVGVIAADTTQLYVCYGGSAAQTPIATGLSPTGVYRITVSNARLSSDVYITIDDISTPGISVSRFQTYLTNDGGGVTMPLPATALAPTLYRGSNGANVSIDILGAYMESDS